MEVEEKERARVWTTILYPEIKKAFEDIGQSFLLALDNTQVSFLVSPEHKPEENEKKPHNHLLLDFGSKKSKEQVKSFLDNLTAFNKDIHFPLAQQVHNKRNMIRYFFHLDSLAKQQFSEDEKKTAVCKGFELADYIVDRPKVKEIEVVRWVMKKTNAANLYELVEECLESKEDYFHFIEKNSYFYSKLLEQKKGKKLFKTT